MTKGAVLFDPEVPVMPVEPKPKSVVVVPEVAPAAAPALVEDASSEHQVGLEPGTNLNPVAEAAGQQEGTHMVFTKNLSVAVNGNQITLTIADPSLRGDSTTSGKSRKVANANGVLDIGGGLRISCSITKDNAK